MSRAIGRSWRRRAGAGPRLTSWRPGKAAGSDSASDAKSATLNFGWRVPGAGLALTTVPQRCFDPDSAPAAVTERQSASATSPARRITGQLRQEARVWREIGRKWHRASGSGGRILRFPAHCRTRRGMRPGAAMRLRLLRKSAADAAGGAPGQTAVPAAGERRSLRHRRVALRAAQSPPDGGRDRRARPAAENR